MHMYKQVLQAAAAAAAVIGLILPVQAEEGTVLISNGYAAILPQKEGVDARWYLSMLTMDGKPAYCIEPQVPVIFDGDRGPEYHPAAWQDASDQQKQAVKRIAYYGYGYPETGTDLQAYVATQMLIWETLQAEDYEINLAGFSLCTTVSHAASACPAGQGSVPQLMEEIRARAAAHAEVPSFVSTEPLEMPADGMLELTDESGVLPHFDADLASLPAGIQVSAEGNVLRISASPDFYLHGAPQDLTIEIPRRQQEWDSMQAGLIIYASGVSQRIYCDSGIEPTPSFSLRLHLPTASILLHKQDEYGRPTEGAGFQVGLDPEMSRRILAEDGSVRTFLSDAKGSVRIDGLPPQANLYLQEVSAPESCLRSEEIFSLHTGADGSVTEGTWTNALRPVTLRIRKQDSESEEPLSGARFRILEIPASEQEQQFQPGLNGALQEPAAMEDVWFFPEGQEMLLEEFFPGASAFALSESNPHIRIERREDGTHLLGSGHAYALLQYAGSDGIAHEVPICISSSRPQGRISGIPILSAETGRAQETDAAGDPSEQGILEARQLNWGRDYLICETGLPDGYDYGSQEACLIQRLEPEQGTDTAEQIWNNTIRKLRINVRKVDQDDERTPLNSAWFTAEDVTDLQEETAGSAFRPGLQDIPERAEAGQVFYLRRPKEGGSRHRWKIASADAESVRICEDDNGQEGSCFAVPKEGYSAEAPMLYQDIARAVSPLRAGAIFETAEKESIDQIHVYHILALQRSSGLDVFGRPSAERVISGAVLQEEGGDPFTIGQLSSAQQDRMIGTYVTGGLLSEHLEEVPAVPITFEEAAAAAGGAAKLQDGMHVTASLRRSARMPSLEELAELNPAPGSEFRYDGLSWKAEARGPKSWQLSAGGRDYEISEGIVPGAVGFQESAMLRVSGVQRNEQGEAVVCTVISPEQDSWYLQSGVTPAAVMAGKPGVRVEAWRDPADPAPAAVGYTAADGRVLFTGLPEGHWLMRSEDGTSEQQVTAGGLEIHDIPYGHAIRICEIKSPLGYVIGNACQVLTPQASYTEDTVENHRTNAKASVTVRKVLQQRKMGVE